MDLQINKSEHGLHSLPVELLHRIAIHLPCSSILKLSFASRTLYAACYDRLVFRRSAIEATHAVRYHDLPKLQNVVVDDWELESCASEASAEKSDDEEWWPDLDEERLSPGEEWDFDDWGPDEVQRRTAAKDDWYWRWPTITVFDCLSAGDSARIAYAIEKAQHYFYVTPDQRPPYWMTGWERTFGQWLPHLIALRHISCFDLKPESLQLLLWQSDALEVLQKEERLELNANVSEYVQVGFCMVALLLMRMETIPVGRLESQWGFPAIQEGFWGRHLDCYSIIEDLKMKLEEPWNVRLFDFKNRYSLLLYMLFRVYPCQSVEDTPLPSLHLLPLASIMGETIPFKTSADVVTQCRAPDTQTVDLLSGEWIGWYTDRRRSRGDIAPPLNDIHLQFRRSSPPSGIDAEVVVEGCMAPNETQNDHGFGMSTLNGRFSADGEVTMVVTLAPHIDASTIEDPGPSNFRGVLTPFGIVGTCESDHGRNGTWFGFFWFWKKEWSHAW